MASDIENGYLICDDVKACMVCGKPTNRIEVCSEGRLCSKECEDTFYQMVEDQEKAAREAHPNECDCNECMENAQ